MQSAQILSHIASMPIESDAAFAARAEAWREWGFRIALKITGCSEAAGDAVQEALLRAMRSRNSIRHADIGHLWFRRILVRCALDQRPRKNPVQLEHEASDESSLEGLHVRMTLRRLKPHQRAILALALGEELSYAEIAETLEIPIGTVGSRLFAAKEAFRKHWGDPR